MAVRDVAVVIILSYLAYAVGVVVVVTGHELGHFAGAGVAPQALVLASSEASYVHENRLVAPTMAIYLDHFIPAVGGWALLQPSSYRALGEPVAAAWMGPLSPERAALSNAVPCYLAALFALVAGALCMRVPRMPLFAFGMAQGTGEFYALHHLESAGLSRAAAVLTGFGVELLFLVPAAVGVARWARRLSAPPTPGLPRAGGQVAQREAAALPVCFQLLSTRPHRYVSPPPPPGRAPKSQVPGASRPHRDARGNTSLHPRPLAGRP
ncbi:MAG: hypothetical protein ACYDBQ_05140 [Thermoplasmatota archaeon]